MAKKPRTWGYKLLSPLLLTLFRLYYSPRVFGKGNIPEKGAVVICSNHKHVLDQCLAALATRRAINYMAKSEYFKGSFAWFFKLTGCICVNRNGHDEEAKDSANAVLSNDDYKDLSVNQGIEIPVEYYAVGFKKGSDLTAKVNVIFEAFAKIGYLDQLATKYNLATSVITDFSSQK